MEHPVFVESMIGNWAEYGYWQFSGMNVRQNVHDFIRYLSQDLSAGNGDNFRNGGLKKSGKTEILNIF